MWSDDDWLKKFSGKTLEEAEAEAVAAGEAPSKTQEVRTFCFVFRTLSLFRELDSRYLRYKVTVISHKHGNEQSFFLFKS